MSDKQEYPRSFYFKLYKIFCKMLHVTCLCYGKINKHSKIECIYGIDSTGLKYKLFNKKGCILQLKLFRREKSDVQLAIVKRIMKELEVSDVYFLHESSSFDELVIPKNICCEKLVVEYDINMMQQTSQCMVFEKRRNDCEI